MSILTERKSQYVDNDVHGLDIGNVLLSVSERCCNNVVIIGCNNVVIIGCTWSKPYHTYPNHLAILCYVGHWQT